MATRTVRFEPETERILAEVKKSTGLSVSEILKRGLVAFQRESQDSGTRSAIEIFQSLDWSDEPGAKESAIAPASQAKSAVKAIVLRKHQRNAQNK